MYLHEKVRDLRLRAGLTQKDVARMTYCTNVCICRYERGDRQIPLSYLTFWVRRGELDLNDVINYPIKEKEE